MGVVVSYERGTPVGVRLGLVLGQPYTLNPERAGNHPFSQADGLGRCSMAGMYRGGSAVERTWNKSASRGQVFALA